MSWERFTSPRGAVVAYRVEGNCLENVIWGRMDLAIAERLQREFDALRVRHGQFRGFHSWLEAPSYDPEYRQSWVSWLPKQRGALVETHFLTSSRLVKMGLAVANIALPAIRFGVHDDDASYARARRAFMSDEPPPSRA